MTQVFTRLDRLQQGLFVVLGSALGERFSPAPTLSWAHGEQSFETTSSGGLISLSVAAGPSPLLRSQSRASTVHETESIDVRVTAAAQTLYGVNVNNVPFRYQGQLGDTETEIRDALLGLLNADEAGGYASTSSTATGPDAITIAQSEPGGLYQLSISGPLVAENRIDTGSGLSFTDGQSEVLVSFDIFSKGREPCDGAPAMSQCILAALQSPRYVDELQKWGVGLGAKTTPQDLSAVAGGHWETRQAFSVTVNMYSAWTEPVSTAQSISVTANTQNPATTHTFTVTKP